MQHFLLNLFIALDGVFTNKLRAMLTALGIMFGVAAVIAMMAIGRGAQQELLEQMKLVGTNNIVVEAITEPDDEEEQENDDQEKKRPYSPGLSLQDAENIQALLPQVEQISAEVVLPTPIMRNARQRKGRCVGVNNAFFELNNLVLEKGHYFHERHMNTGAAVCIIGKNTQNKFFSGENPIGQKIKCGNVWLTVIGVLDRRMASSQSLTSLGIRDYNDDIYVPIQTVLLRLKNRTALTGNQLRGFRSEFFVVVSGPENDPEVLNYHQLDKLVIRVKDAAYLQSTAEVIARMLHRRHWEVKDFEVSVPELLLKQQQRTQDIFNTVLGAIAGISLLVGGIGIMNIMLASVLERIKEIGLRRSLGATRQDIVFQFLIEAMFISLIGGIIGIGLGVGLAKIIAQFADIPTIVSAWSVILAFGVAAGTGLVFGIVPAQRAARLDPIIALRNE